MLPPITVIFFHICWTFWTIYSIIVTQTLYKILIKISVQVLGFRNTMFKTKYDKMPPCNVREYIICQHGGLRRTSYACLSKHWRGSVNLRERFLINLVIMLVFCFLSFYFCRWTLAWTSPKDQMIDTCGTGPLSLLSVVQCWVEFWTDKIKNQQLHSI